MTFLSINKDKVKSVFDTNSAEYDQIKKKEIINSVMSEFGRRTHDKWDNPK